MKLILEHRDDGPDEIIIKYQKMTELIEGIVNYVERKEHTLIASKDNEKIILKPADIIYFESVDGVTFIYTYKEIYRSSLSLASIQSYYIDEGYFRCSKSMVINIYHITHLKSEPGNRIDATMDNGEHVIISRRYAKELRSILREARG